MSLSSECCSETRGSRDRLYNCNRRRQYDFKTTHCAQLSSTRSSSTSSLLSSSSLRHPHLLHTLSGLYTLIAWKQTLFRFPHHSALHPHCPPHLPPSPLLKPSPVLVHLPFRPHLACSFLLLPAFAHGRVLSRAPDTTSDGLSFPRGSM